jgi:hypothetical protein
MKGVT